MQSENGDQAKHAFGTSISIPGLQFLTGNGDQAHEFNGKHKGGVGRNDTAKPTRAWKYRA